MIGPGEAGLAARVGLVAAFALGTALATGLGTLPFLFVSTVSRRAMAYANAVAAGLMLGASFGLAAEGTELGGGATFAGGLLGVLFVLVVERRIGGWRAEGEGTGPLPAASSLFRRPGGRTALLIVLIMTAHSFTEGIAVGSAFAGEAELALFVTGAIAIHNVPEGLAVTAVLRPRGASLPACAAWSVASSLPQPLMAVPAFLVVEAFHPFLPWGTGFAAGAMAFMIVRELLPEAYEEASRPAVGLLASLTFVGMLLVQRAL